jgi:hypothetical protein
MRKKSKYRNRKKKSKSKSKYRNRKKKSRSKSKKSKTNHLSDGGMLNKNIFSNPYFKIGLLLGENDRQPQQRCDCQNDFNAIDREIEQINQRLDNFIERL